MEIANRLLQVELLLFDLASIYLAETVDQLGRNPL